MNIGLNLGIETLTVDPHCIGPIFGQGFGQGFERVGIRFGSDYNVLVISDMKMTKSLGKFSANLDGKNFPINLVSFKIKD